MSEAIIKELLKQAKLSADAARRSATEKRINIYSDHWKTILKEEIDAQFDEKTRDNVKQMVDDSSNVLKRIIKEISIVYQRAAVRSYIVGEKENEVYQKVMQQIPTDVIMQETNRFTNLCNESLIYTVPRNKRIEYDLLTPDQVEIFQDEDDPTRPVAILFIRTLVDTVGNTEVFKIYWDVYGNHKVFNEDDQEIENFGNPYKDPNDKEKTILPFVIFHKDYPRDAIWNETGGEDLVSGTIQVGVKLTYLNYLYKTNSFKQLYMTGVDNSDLPKNVVLDQLYPLSTKTVDAEFGILDHQSQIRELWETIYGQVGSLANNYGLSIDNFKLSADAESGFALRIKNLGLEKVVDEQRKIYRYWENELFNVTKIVNNTMQSELKTGKIPDDGTFKIDFAETEYPESPKNIREQWAFDLKIGAKNVYQYLMSVNPDISDEKQAEKFLQKNVEINKDVKETHGIDIDALIDSALSARGQGGGQAGGGEGLL